MNNRQVLSIFVVLNSTCLLASENAQEKVTQTAVTSKQTCDYTECEATTEADCFAIRHQRDAHLKACTFPICPLRTKLEEQRRAWKAFEKTHSTKRFNFSY